MTWILWALLLVAQNVANTTVSRARNSRSLWYHGIASVFANGVFAASLFLFTDKVAEARTIGNWWHIALILLFYIVFTVTGSVTAHYVLIHKVENKLR